MNVFGWICVEMKRGKKYDATQNHENIWKFDICNVREGKFFAGRVSAREWVS